MSKALLHIGSPKTGSTTIQRYLHEARCELLENNIFYYPGQVNHTFLYDEFRSRGNKQSPWHIDNFDMLNDSGKDVIISSEYLSLLSFSEICNIKEWVSERFEEVVFLCYLRHPVDYARSQIQQLVKRGRGDLKNLLESPPWSLPFKCVRSYIDIFGEESVVLRPFEREQLEGGDVLNDFLSFAGVPFQKEQMAGGYKNKSMSFESVLLADSINALLEKRGKCREFLVEDLDMDLELGSKFVLPEECVEKILKQSESDLVFLKESCGLNFLSGNYFQQNSIGSAQKEWIKNVAEIIVKLKEK